MDFNLNSWNDYLLGGAFGYNAQWYLSAGTLVGSAYGPRLPSGFSFAEQHFKTCTFGVAPTAKTVSGTTTTFFVVNVVTEFGCTWTYHSNTSWIHVSAGTQPRIGGGLVGVTVDPGPAEVGTITVQGQTITITRGANGPLTGHWGGITSVNNGCSNFMIQPDAHLIQNGTTVTGTWSVNGLPCPCGQPGTAWNDSGTVTGTVTGNITTPGSITIHVVGVT